MEPSQHNVMALSLEYLVAGNLIKMRHFYQQLTLERQYFWVRYVILLYSDLAETCWPGNHLNQETAEIKSNY